MSKSTIKIGGVVLTHKQRVGGLSRETLRNAAGKQAIVIRASK